VPVLPISNPPPALRETVYSYLSRLAAAWQTDVADLAHDMGAPFKRFLEQDPEAFEALAAWADLDPRQVEEMRSWTGVRAGNVRMKFRGGLFVSRALRNPVMRGCPVCLREDGARHGGQGIAAMIMRGDWQLREVVVCVRHRHPLVRLWKSDKPQDRYDIGARLREIEGDILSGAFDQPEAAPSAYDLWLDGRLQDGRDDTWLKGQPLSASTTFCRLLGRALRKDQPEGTPVSGRVHAAGFDVARHGEISIREAFDRIAAAATGHLDEPNKAFGAVYQALNSGAAQEDGFARFCRILRECILDHWPIAPGEILLGEIVTERRLHSLVTAAKEIDVGVQVIEHFLLEVGGLPEQDDRPWSRRVFDAQAHAKLLAEIPTLVGPKAMREAMGATMRELVALEAEKLLIPRTRVAKVRNPWRIPDGTAFVAELLTRAIPVAKDDDDWETLLLARRRSDVSLSGLIEAIREEQLSVGQRVGIAGFHGVVVCKNDVDGLASTRRTAEKPVEMELPGVMSAAEFGRAIGLRDHGNFVALIEAGHILAGKYTNSRTGRPQYRLGADEIASFHRRFVTLTTLSEETGYHRNTLKSLLEASRVTRFTPEGQDFGPVYPRAEAIKALG